MSNRLTRGFCVNLGAVAMLAASLSISALPGAQAQTASATPAAGTSTATTSTAGGAGSTSSTTTTTSTSSDGSSSSAAAPTAPTSDIPPGVLWTDPKYAVKEVPAPVRVPVPSVHRPTTGTKGNATATPAKPVDTSGIYDEKEATDFATSVGAPAYLWNKQPDKTIKTQKAEANTSSKEMAAYNKSLVQKFVSNMSVPNSATLVESSSANYLYLLSFTIDADGKIKNINSEKSAGPLSAVNLADDTENASMTSTITSALTKCSPVKKPTAGLPPWNMMLKYEPNTGKVFVSQVNAL
jgi:hypothetical protein